MERNVAMHYFCVYERKNTQIHKDFLVDPCRRVYVVEPG